MSDLICVTNRNLCKGEFLTQIQEIAREKPKAVILREKDMNEEAYRVLAEQVTDICKKQGTCCILHSFAEVARELQAEGVHMPLGILRSMTEQERRSWKYLGTSCHSLEEALEAERLGCTYLVAGHIFPTDCKKGVPARGLDFLKKICDHVTVPVYGIGGINPQNFASVKEAGACGGCVMSGLMECRDVPGYMEEFYGKCK